MIRPRAPNTKVARPAAHSIGLQSLTASSVIGYYAGSVFLTKDRQIMKVIGTAAIALALLGSGSAFAHGDGDGYRGYRHEGDGYGRHHDRGGYGYRGHDRYYGGHYRPGVVQGYYAAPVYVAPPPVVYGAYGYGYRYPQQREGVTVILPPIRIGF